MQERPRAVVRPSTWWAGFFTITTFAIAMTAVAYLEGLPEAFRQPGFDKLVHFGTAGLLAFFLDGALRRRTLTITGTFGLPLAAAIVLVPVGLEEFMQRYATFRTSSFLDFAADAAGVIVFIPLSRRAAA